MPNFDVNTEEVIDLTVKLKKLHRSAFPSAVRNTLNEAALDMKKEQILKSATKNFKTIRSKSFFKKYTTAEKSKGFNIKSMVAKVGFVDRGNRAAQQATDGMEHHEHGGSVKGGYSYGKDSRIAGSYARLVRKKNIYDKSNIVTRASRKIPRSQRGRNMQSIMQGAKQKKAFWLDTNKGRKLAVVSRYNAKKPKNTKIKFLMSERQKDVSISKNSFMSEASEYEEKRIPLIFKAKAEFQFKKHLK